MNNKSKKVAIITGAAGDIGRDIVAKLGDAGFITIGLDRTPPIIDHPVFETDLNLFVNSPEIQNEFMEFSQPYCEQADEISLINNAAIQIIGNMSTLTTAEITRSLNVNAIAPFLLSQLLVNKYERKLHTIINISSIHSKLTKVNFGAYAMSKASLSALTRSLSLEIGHKTRVCEIQPAAIDTEMLRAGLQDEFSFSKLENCHPSGKIGQADDIASMVLTILESPSIFLNGMIVNLDGGISNRLHDPE